MLDDVQADHVMLDVVRMDLGTVDDVQTLYYDGRIAYRTSTLHDVQGYHRRGFEPVGGENVRSL